jgi:hypothetical protein
MAEQDLILTVVQGVDFDYLAPFIFSLKRTGYRGKLIVLASAMKDGAVAQLESHGATVIPFSFHSKRLREIFFWPAWPLWRHFFKKNTASKFKESVAHYALPLFYRRHLICLQFLRMHGHKFDRVFLSDARDVYFQADPFSWNPPPGLHFFLLHPEHTVNSSELHLNWKQNQFDRTDASPHLNQVVSCAGTTFGDTPTIITYLSQLVALSLRTRKLRKIAGGDDQAVHNYMIYEKLLPAMTLHANEEGAVLTTTSPMTMKSLSMDANGRLVDKSGKIIPILHQYDRVPGLKEHLLSRL